MKLETALLQLFGLLENPVDQLGKRPEDLDFLSGLDIEFVVNQNPGIIGDTTVDLSGVIHDDNVRRGNVAPIGSQIKRSGSAGEPNPLPLVTTYHDLERNHRQIA